MELTAEQKYLKALAEWLDIETIPKNRIQEASREYLDQFTDAGEMVDGCPEVGNLYRRNLNGVITEITSIKSNRVRHVIHGFDYDPDVMNCYHEDNITDFIKEYEPIAELEGLKVGDCVYSELGEAWSIDNIDVEVIVIIGQGLIELDIKGVPYTFTNQKLFWRTADRAERFGRGDA